MPQTRRLIADQGATFDRYYVEQSTCCTSRASILSGEYTHNHGVRGNHYPAGGFFRWHEGRESTALPTWLEANGYRSALLGKYLNEYPYPGGYDGTEAQKTALEEFVPPGLAVVVQPRRRHAVPPARHRPQRQRRGRHGAAHGVPRPADG